MMEDQEHKLSKKIERTVNGEKQDVFVVTLVCPVKKFIRKTYLLQQLLKQAYVQQLELYSSINNIREKLNIDSGAQEETKDDKEEWKSILETLKSSKVDIDQVFTEFERLAKLGAVQIDGSNLKDKNWEDMEFEDQEALMAKYLFFFVSTLVES